MTCGTDGFFDGFTPKGKKYAQCDVDKLAGCSQITFRCDDPRCARRRFRYYGKSIFEEGCREKPSNPANYRNAPSS